MFVVIIVQKCSKNAVWFLSKSALTCLWNIIQDHFCTNYFQFHREFWVVHGRVFHSQFSNMTHLWTTIAPRNKVILIYFSLSNCRVIRRVIQGTIRFSDSNTITRNFDVENFVVRKFAVRKFVASNFVLFLIVKLYFS